MAICQVSPGAVYVAGLLSRPRRGSDPDLEAPRLALATGPHAHAHGTDSANRIAHVTGIPTTIPVPFVCRKISLTLINPEISASFLTLTLTLRYLQYSHAYAWGPGNEW